MNLNPPKKTLEKRSPNHVPKNYEMKKKKPNHILQFTLWPHISKRAIRMQTKRENSVINNMNTN